MPKLEGAQTPVRDVWETPAVILSVDCAETKGGFQSPVVVGEVHFPSLGSTSNFHS